MARDASIFVRQLFKKTTPALISRAEEAQRGRDWHEAEKRWRRVVEQAPRETGAWVQLGNMLNELERRAEAIDAFRHAGRLDPLLAHAPAGIAGVHERAGRWDEAGEAWLEAMTLLLVDQTRAADDAELVHAIAHAALSARNSSDRVKGNLLLERAIEMHPSLEMRPDSLAIWVHLLPEGSSAITAAFFRSLLEMLPSVAADVRELPGVRRGDRFGALHDLIPYLKVGMTNPGFLSIALDLYENSRFWREAMLLAEWLAALEPRQPDHLARAFRAAAAGRRLLDARRLARLHVSVTGDLILLHQLAVLYEDARLPVRARLLFRYLKRRWPHSRWHVGKYIVATAATRSLPLADLLVRRELNNGRRDQELERASCQSAFEAGHYDEARRRLVHYLRHHDDHDADVLLGYAVANSRGLDESAEHFRNLAARDLQSLAAMSGSAHMAMRKRDLPLALDRWGEIATVHSGAGNADVERARCAYDLGDIMGAIRICRERLASHDIAMKEFYAWLLTMTGHYDAARSTITTLLGSSGPNWHAADLQVICSSQLGTLDEDWSKITAMMPASDSGEAMARIYHLGRILIAVGRQDLAIKTLLREEAPIGNMPWARPYLRAAKLPDADPRTAKAARNWRLSAAMTRSDFSAGLDAMSGSEVDDLLGRTPADLPTVHIINKFEQPRGGSELHALDLADQISRYANTKIWAPEMPHPEFTARHRVSHIDPATGTFPRGGILVLIGVYFDIARWIDHVQPTRIIILYNTFEAPSLFARIDEAWRRTGVRPEILFCSDLMQLETELPGRFEPSPTDLELFSPAVASRPAFRPFTLGRHSRDVPEKHGRDDWKIYQEVAALEGESILLGGTCMGGAFPAIHGMKLLKARSTGIPDFLHGLDAYFYRTSTWIEPWGRVVIEAMACGLPVLVHSVGGYAQVIRHEVNGLLFDTTDEAVRLVRRLAEEPDLRLQLGIQARRSACALLAPTELKRMIAFYLLSDRAVLS